MKKSIILYILLIIALTDTKGQDSFNIVRLNIEGKEYQKMNMNIFSINGKGVGIKGETENDKDWIFSYPDSLYKNLLYVRFAIPTEIDTLVHTTSFKVLTDIDTIEVGQLVIEKNAKLKMQYNDTSTREGVAYWKDKGVISYKNQLIDNFLISNKDDSELNIYASYYKGEFNKEELADAVKKFPDSHYLMTELAEKVNNAAPEAEVEYIYNNFSEEIKNSFLGKKVYEYLYLIDHSIFENFRLQAWNSDQLEPIAIDTTKYNLIVFSASWCAPCHEQIPILKEIFNDLNGKLDMVYISIDEKETKERWRQLMIKEQIPWRSLLALNDINKVGKKYKVVTIPHTMLLHPDGTMEKIDLRKSEEKRQLYNLVK